MLYDQLVHIVSITSAGRAEQARMCYALGYHAEIYSNTDEFLAAAPIGGIAVVEDIAERGGVGEMMERMGSRGFWLPVIATAPAPDPRRVVEAVKMGVLDYVPLPLDSDRFAASLRRIGEEAAALGAQQRRAVDARGRLSRLTAREREVLDLLAAGASNKMIGRELEISPRTVEIHRANMMAKLGASRAADAVRLRLEAAMGVGSPAIPLTVRTQAA